jgi:hypothetical protein
MLREGLQVTVYVKNEVDQKADNFHGADFDTA